MGMMSRSSASSYICKLLRASDKIEKGQNLSKEEEEAWEKNKKFNERLVPYDRGKDEECQVLVEKIKDLCKENDVDPYTFMYHEQIFPDDMSKKELQEEINDFPETLEHYKKYFKRKQ